MMLAIAALVLAAEVAAPAPAPATGGADKVEIVLFSDFQCPFCASLSGPIRALQSEGASGSGVTVRFRHFPLTAHPKAPLAHRAALAAAEQGRFWEMHDLLFANQAHAERADLVAYGKRLGLDLDRFVKDLDSDRFERVIAGDVAEGQKLHISGTPTFYVNGHEYSGTQSLDQLRQIVTGERQRARAVADVTDLMLSRGPAGAPVTIELFADLQSPISGPTLGVVDQVMSRYPTAVRLQFRSFPLAFHPQARLAHEAAMAAAKSGQFWTFVALVVSHQDALGEQDVIDMAGRLGLDQASFASAIHQRTYAPRVDADLQTARARGIRGSPVVVVNGTRIDGLPDVDQLVKTVESALAAAAQGPEKHQP